MPKVKRESYAVLKSNDRSFFKRYDYELQKIKHTYRSNYLNALLLFIYLNFINSERSRLTVAVLTKNVLTVEHCLQSTFELSNSID